MPNCVLASRLAFLLLLLAAVVACSPGTGQRGGTAKGASNVYRETGAGRLSPSVAGALNRVYVPNIGSNDVYVINPATLKVVDRYMVGRAPQHVVPSWDLKTLWVTGSADGRIPGSLTSIDPTTGKPTRILEVEDA